MSVMAECELHVCRNSFMPVLNRVEEGNIFFSGTSDNCMLVHYTISQEPRDFEGCGAWFNSTLWHESKTPRCSPLWLLNSSNVLHHKNILLSCILTLILTKGEACDFCITGVTKKYICFFKEVSHTHSYRLDKLIALPKRVL